MIVLAVKLIAHGMQFQVGYKNGLVPPSSCWSSYYIIAIRELKGTCQNISVCCNLSLWKKGINDSYPLSFLILPNC